MPEKLGIYLAARFISRKRLCTIREVLKDHYGFEVTSRWLDVSDNRPAPGTEEWSAFCRKNSIVDTQDAIRADIVILDLIDGVGTRFGNWVELGIGLGLTVAGRKRYNLVVGDTDNVFTYHPHVTKCKNWEETYYCLEVIKKDYFDPDNYSC